MKRQISDISDSVPAIEALIAEREQFRIQKQWDESDRIRDQLRDTYGVKIFDQERIWRSDDGKVGAIIRSSDDPSRQTRLIDSQVKRVRPLCRVINRLLYVYRLRH